MAGTLLGRAMEVWALENSEGDEEEYGKVGRRGLDERRLRSELEGGLSASERAGLSLDEEADEILNAVTQQPQNKTSFSKHMQAQASSQESNFGRRTRR